MRFYLFLFNEFRNDDIMSSFGIDYDGPLPSNEYNGDTWNDFSVQVP